MPNLIEPSPFMIQNTRTMLAEFLSVTPLIAAPSLDGRLGGKYLMKLEMLQPTGSFKVRGAFSKLLRLPQDEPTVTASSGNHGAATAYAAHVLNRDAVIFVPENTPRKKIDNIARFDVCLKRSGQSYDECEENSREFARVQNLQWVSPYCDREVIAGQGTVALELLEQEKNIDTLVVPVGGGGLISGIAVAIKDARPQTKVVGVQPEASCPMYRSVQAGRLVHVEHGPTLSEATAGDIPPETLDTVMRYVDEMVIVSEEEIEDAIRHLLFEESIVVEGAGALAPAAVMAHKIAADGGGKIILLLSGRNIDSEVIARLAAL